MALISLSRGKYFGRSLRRLAIGPFELTETVYQPDESPSAHRHDVPTLFIVLSGRLTEQTSTGSAVHPKHTAVFNPSGVEHEARFEGNNPSVLNVQFDTTWFETEACPDPASRLIAPRVLALPAITSLRAMLAEGVTNVSHLDRIIKDILIARLPGRNRELAYRAAKLIEQNAYFRSRITRVALELDVERTRLAHMFRREFNVSMQEFAARVRFAIAYNLLEETQENLASIAHTAGFADQCHMTRDIQRRVGVPPGRLREILRAEVARFTPIQDN